MKTASSSSGGSAPSSPVASSKKELSIHKIRELQLQSVDIHANYDIIKEIGSGDYGKVILAAHKISGFEVNNSILLCSLAETN